MTESSKKERTRKIMPGTGSSPVKKSDRSVSIGNSGSSQKSLQGASKEKSTKRKRPEDSHTDAAPAPALSKEVIEEDDDDFDVMDGINEASGKTSATASTGLIDKEVEAELLKDDREDENGIDDDDDDDMDRDDEYVPPRGFKRVYVEADATWDASALDKNDPDTEVWLIRIPADVPLDSIRAPLESIAFPTGNSAKPLTTITRTFNNNTSAQTKSSKSANNNHELKYNVYDLTPSTAKPSATFTVNPGGELGEMRDFKLLLPDRKRKSKGARRIVTRQMTRFFSIVPDIQLPSVDDWKAAAEKVLARPFIPRPLPPNMKAQFEPMGSSTDGESFSDAMKRYKHSTENGVSVTPSKKKKQKTKA